MAINAKDFTFCDKKLSDFGFIIANFDKDNDNSASAGNIEVVTSRPPNSSRNYIHGFNYGEPITLTFQIIKFDFTACQCSNYPVSSLEQDKLLKWLIKPNYNYLKFDTLDTYFNVFIKAVPKRVGGDIYGFEITATNDSIYSYSEERTAHVSANTTSMVNQSHTDFITYPTVTFQVKDDGDISIKCENDTNSLSVISNCTAGEVIYMDCENCIINSSNESHKVYNDFNLVFFRLHFENGEMCKITTTNATATIKFREKRMVVI